MEKCLHALRSARTSAMEGRLVSAHRNRPPENVPLMPGGHAEAIGDPTEYGIARAPARQGPYPERKKATRYSTKLRRYVKSTPVRPPPYLRPRPTTNRPV